MKLLKTSILLTVATIMLGTGAAFAASDVVVLKLAHFWPSNSHFNKDIVEPWCDKISKESGGRLKCQIYPSMQLGGTPQQLFTQVRDGVADLAWTLPSYQAGLFTKSEVFELPFMVKHPETASQAMWDYVQKYALDEYKGVKLIATHTHDGAHLHFGKKQIKTLEDLKVNYDFLMRNALLAKLEISVNVLYHHMIILQGSSSYKALQEQGRLNISTHSTYEADTDYLNPRVAMLAGMMRDMTNHIFSYMKDTWELSFKKDPVILEKYRLINQLLVQSFENYLDLLKSQELSIDQRNDFVETFNRTVDEIMS